MGYKLDLCKFYENTLCILYLLLLDEKSRMKVGKDCIKGKIVPTRTGNIKFMLVEEEQQL